MTEQACEPAPRRWFRRRNNDRQTLKHRDTPQTRDPLGCRAAGPFRQSRKPRGKRRATPVDPMTIGAHQVNEPPGYPSFEGPLGLRIPRFGECPRCYLNQATGLDPLRGESRVVEQFRYRSA